MIKLMSVDSLNLSCLLLFMHISILIVLPTTDDEFHIDSTTLSTGTTARVIEATGNNM